MSPVDKLATAALLIALVLFTAAFLLREHRLELEEARRNLDRRPVVDDAYMAAIDAGVDEVAARRALRPHGQVENVVPLHSRKRGPAA